MRKILYLLFLMILLVSCENIWEADKIYFHGDLAKSYIDEYNSYDDNHYINTSHDDYSFNYLIKEKTTNKIVDNISITKLVKYSYIDYIFISNEGVFYAFYHNDKEDKIICYYKRIGNDENINKQYIEVHESNKYIEVNNLRFMVDYEQTNGSTSRKFFVSVVGHNINQYNQSNRYYCSIDNEKEIYNISVTKDEIVITNYYDHSIYYNYFVSDTIKESECSYNHYLNNNYFYGGSSIDEYVLENSVNILSETVKLMEDGNLYFAYGKYLGEFKESYCYSYEDCFLSNRICEILRFNTKSKKIENVAILPSSYNVLAIYEDCAVVINNKMIGTYYYDTKEIQDIFKIDFAKRIFENNYGYPKVKFYFKDKKIEKYEVINMCATIEGFCSNVDII